MRVRYWALVVVAANFCVTPSFAEDADRYAPAPHVSVPVPKGWTVCQETTGKVFANAPDPVRLRFAEALCVPSARPSSTMGLGDPERPLVVVLLPRPEPKAVPGALSVYTQQSVDQFSAGFCATTGTLLSVTLSGCVVAPGTLSGQPAIVGHATGHFASGTAIAVRMALISYTGGILEVYSAAPDNGTPDPDIEVIYAAIAVE